MPIEVLAQTGFIGEAIKQMMLVYGALSLLAVVACFLAVISRN